MIKINTKRVVILSILAVLVIGFVLISGCMKENKGEGESVEEKPTITTPAGKEENTTSSIPSYDLELDIRIPKSTYEVGELLTGEYYMRYTGEPFKGIVLYCNSREGVEKKHCSRSRGMIDDIDFEKGRTNALKVALKAFRLDENTYSSTLDYFYEEGTYTFSISVYNCSTIERELDKEDCGGALRDIKTEKLLNIQPLKSKSRSIVVSSGQSKSECKTSNDCTKLCEGCKKGKQICEKVKEICMDCFFDGMCKEGYNCEQHECIKK